MQTTTPPTATAGGELKGSRTSLLQRSSCNNYDNYSPYPFWIKLRLRGGQTMPPAAEGTQTMGDIGTVHECNLKTMGDRSASSSATAPCPSRQHQAQLDSTTPIACPSDSSHSTRPIVTAPGPARQHQAQPIIDVDEIAAQPDDLADLPLPDNSDTESDQSSSHISDVAPNSDDSSLEVMTAMSPLGNTHRDSSMPNSNFRPMATRRMMCGSHKYFAIAKDLPPGTVNNIIPLGFS